MVAARSRIHTIRQSRLAAAPLLIGLLFACLAARLFFLQLLMGPAVRAAAIQSREDRIVLPAHQGAILDRAGHPLAISVYSGALGFDPSVAWAHEGQGRPLTSDEIRSSAWRLAQLLHAPIEPMLAKIDAAIRDYPRAPRCRFVLLQRGISLFQAESIRSARPRLAGFGVSDGAVRFYSGGASAAQVVGFSSASGAGLEGLELGCAAWLRGRNGFATAEVDPLKREIPGTLRKLSPAEDGLDVHTTLDADAQQIATEEAESIYSQFHPHGVAIIVEEPQTGNIRAMVSVPNFDANPTPQDPGVRPPIPSGALRNRCVGALYEPGSTMKSLTIAAALDEHVVTPETTFYCSGSYRVGNRTIHEAHGEVHHTVDPQIILCRSCNIGAAQVGLLMGARRLCDAFRRFGIMDRLDLHLPGVQYGRWSFDSSAHAFSAAKAARSAFGQAVTTTPLHMALAYGAIANGGVLMAPRLVSELTSPGGKVVESWQPRAIRRVIKKSTAAEVRGMLRTVVSEGTGRCAAIPGYQIAGKTGTASCYKPGAYVGSFIGMIPAGPDAQPRAVILVVVDRPDPSAGYYGAEVAAPAFRAIARRLATLWHMPEDDPEGLQAAEAARDPSKPAAAQPIASSR